MNRLGSRVLATLVVTSTCMFGSGIVAHAETATDPAAQSATASSAQSVQAKVDALLATSGLPAAARDQVRALFANLPADIDTRLAAATAPLKQQATNEYSDLVNSVINPGDYQCTSTPVQEWLTHDLTTTDILVYAISGLLAIPDLPIYDALLFGQEGKSNRFGVDGSYTHLLTSEMKDLRQFWEFDGSAIQLVPLKSDIYANPAEIVRVYQALGLDAATAQAFADVIPQLFALAPGLQNGKHPIFTFNSFAFDPTGEPEPLGSLPKKIIMGDGIMQGYSAALGDDNVAPRAILGHEYGHQVQYADNLFVSDLPAGAEQTRRTELMADALGTYFTVHSRGEALNATRTLADQQTFYNVGDCGFTSAGHHGTPLQRERSAIWATSVVDDAANQGHKLTGVQFGPLFDQQLPTLVAPDAN